MKKSATAHHVNRRPQIRLALSRPEVAIAIGVSTSSIDRMVSDGALPPPRIWHSRKLWLVSEVEAYLNEWPTDGQADGDNLIDRNLGRFEEAHYGPRKGVGGYPIFSDPTHPVKQYFDRLGFDPATMGNAELQKLQAIADERWRASIPGTRLGKREQKALAQLAEYGVGVPVHWSKIKDCGTDTEERLKARGYLETRNHTKFPDQVDLYILTMDGLKAWESIQ
ncbi:helix-turn-helix transcriptional regulator [Nitratireductor aquimarinus]|uniref:helix-turn-helix transcriptional regulator n=1 Tax=Nitratireductor aquimarinus TaxID=889300 RepID=UPI00398EB1F1